MKQSNIVLFFTNKIYRWATLERWKIKICFLPVIRHVISWWKTICINRKMRSMTSWEQHVYVKSVERQTEKFLFACALTRFAACIMAEGEQRNNEDFIKEKQVLLESEYINSSEMREFKEWLEQITADETDYTKVKAVMEMLAKPE